MRKHLEMELKMLEKMLLTAARAEADILYARKRQVELELEQATNTPNTRAA
jgi:hypothetical protein